MGKQSLVQKLALQQKLSPQQILLMKMLQLPAIALEQRIKQEIEENPALEEVQNFDEIGSQDNLTEKLNENESSNADNDEFDLSDFLDEDEIPHYRLTVNNYSPDDEKRQLPLSVGKTFQEYLLSQIGLRNLTEKQMIIASNLVGNLDDAGYLRRELSSLADDLLFQHNLSVTVGEIEEVLRIIQELDPPGVGARNLQECLLIQLRRKREESPHPAIDLAFTIIDKYFDEFTKKHYDKIIRRAKITEQQLREAIEEILHLNPKPGGTFSEEAAENQYIIPDFIITNINGELELTLNSKNTPELRINRQYVDMIESYLLDKSKKSREQKETIQFIKSKIESAKWFIDAIRQRQDTLYRTMKAIVDYQKDFFLTGDETRLRPMILKDIAEIVGLDISTVSRVANSKYVQTPYGTYPLKFFFSESMQTDSGEEVSTREIKKILQECIDQEDKARPLTDDQITEILRSKGYNIARRTVAKYREQLNIPVARLRKEL